MTTLTTAIRLPAPLIKEAKMAAMVSMRTVPAQVAYWMMIGKTAEENPDLPVGFIMEIFKAKAQKSEPFDFK